MGFLTREIDYYDRNIDFVDGYFQQLKKYLELRAGRPLEDKVVQAFIDKEFGKGGRFELKSPEVTINIRDPKTSDRRRAKTDLLKLMSVIKKNELILSPAMTAFLPPKIKKSLLSEFIDLNVAMRGKVKKEMFAARAAGNEMLATNKQNEQTSFKTRNNALSGAASSASTILYNKAMHSTLTSICRCATSYGNTNNEKLIGGNRHYWAPGVVVNNILATCQLTDFEEFSTCLLKYNMYMPTVEDVMEVIRYSTDPLWRNFEAIQEILTLVKNLSPLERAAFVYIGDFYHVAKFNDQLMRDVVGRFVTLADKPVEDYGHIEKLLDGDTQILLSLNYSHLIGPRNLKEVKEKNHDDYKLIMAGAEKLYQDLMHYKDFFQAILFTKNVPASIAKVPELIRRVAMVSDTDSTMGTTQWWADWYCGEGTVSREADAVADTITYFAVQNIAHMMARFSANMGVAKETIFRYAMKNEYKFPAFALTSNAKHYFSIITSQEGTLNEHPELEVKGVILRTSNIPPVVMGKFRKTIEDLCTKTALGQKLSLFKYIQDLVDLEYQLTNSIRGGELTYLKTGNIKSKDGYKTVEGSKYVYHQMWDAVFAPKYGYTGEPPYNIVKVPLDLDTNTKMKDWLEGIEDRALAERMRMFMEKKSGGKTLSQMLVPSAICVTNGFPKELRSVVDHKKTVFEIVEPFYHVLEVMGIFMMDPNHVRLVSEYYPPSE